MHKVGRFVTDRYRFRNRWVRAMRETLVPMRLIDGPIDPNSGRHMADRYREVIPNPDIVMLADDIAHWPQIEAPEAVLAHFLVTSSASSPSPSASSPPARLLRQRSRDLVGSRRQRGGQHGHRQLPLPRPRARLGEECVDDGGDVVRVRGGLPVPAEPADRVGSQQILGRHRKTLRQFGQTRSRRLQPCGRLWLAPRPAGRRRRPGLRLGHRGQLLQGAGPRERVEPDLRAAALTGTTEHGQRRQLLHRVRVGCRSVDDRGVGQDAARRDLSPLRDVVARGPQLSFQVN